MCVDGVTGMVQIHVCVCVCVAYIFGEKWSVSLATDHGHYYSSLPLAVATATRLEERY